MTARPLILIGDSQVTIFLRAVEELGVGREIIGTKLAGGFRFFDDFFAADGDGIRWTQGGFQGRFEAMTGGADLEACGGCLVLSIGLSPAPFYGSLSRQRVTFPPLPPRRMHARLSDGALDAAIRDLQRPAVNFYRSCLERGLVFAAAAAAPPQRRHPAAAQFGNLLPALARRYEAPVRSVLAEHGIPIIEPEEAIDPDGFLLERYWGADWSHGNVEFGKLVIRDLLACRGTRGVPVLQESGPVEVPVG